MYTIEDEWRPRLQAAIEAALEEEYPRKPSGQRARKAGRVLDGIQSAEFACYRWGAVAAAFDVLTFCRNIAAPLPPHTSFIAEQLMRDALTRGESTGKALARHHSALRDRLRWAAVNSLLESGREHKHSSEIITIERQDGTKTTGKRAIVDWQADIDKWEEWEEERPEASDEVTKASKIAQAQHASEWHVDVRAVHSSWRKVETAISAHDSDPFKPWPGIYYVPTVETMESLGWSDLFPLVTEYGGSNFPDLGMV